MRGDDSEDEVQRRGCGEHAAVTNTQVDPCHGMTSAGQSLGSMCMVARIAASLAKA